jgi:hypothetical protein
MARLSEQLKYFINKKVSEDSAWQSVQVIFSGHDVSFGHPWQTHAFFSQGKLPSNSYEFKTVRVVPLS